MYCSLKGAELQARIAKLPFEQVRPRIFAQKTGTYAHDTKLALTTLQSKAVGAELIRQLTSQPQPLYVIPDTDGHGPSAVLFCNAAAAPPLKTLTWNAVAWHVARATGVLLELARGPGSSGVVTWDAQYSPDPDYPPFIPLGHELIHILRALLGINLFKFPTPESHLYKAGAASRFRAENFDEVCTTMGCRGWQQLTEASLTREHGLKVPTTHSPGKDKIARAQYQSRHGPGRPTGGGR